MRWLKLFKRKRKLYTFTPDYTVRPSQSILEAMEFANVSVWQLWSNSQLMISDIFVLLADEERISWNVAIEISKVLGNEPEFWFNLSKNYHDKKVCHDPITKDYNDSNLCGTCADSLKTERDKLIAEVAELEKEKYHYAARLLDKYSQFMCPPDTCGKDRKRNGYCDGDNSDCTRCWHEFLMKEEK